MLKKKLFEEISIIIVNYNRKKETYSCIKSVKLDKYIKEIICIDNGSTDNSFEFLNNKFRKKNKIKLFKTKKNLGAGGGRNYGAKKSSGKFLLFIDSDNVISKNMPKILLNSLKSDDKIIMNGPVSLYKSQKKKIWCLDAWISKFTSIAKYNFNKKNYHKIKKDTHFETDHILNCFMVSKKNFYRISGFDQRYFIMYEEADFASRLKKKLKGKIIIVPRAKVFHDVPYNIKNSLDTGDRGKLRMYLIIRNRVLYIFKNSNFAQKVLFISLFYPLITLFYIISFMKDLKFNYIGYILNGFKDGLLFRFKNDFD